MAVKVIIDTNVLVSSLASKSPFHKIIRDILAGDLELYITADILMEYEEVFCKKYSQSVASNFVAALIELPNVFYTTVYFRWNLLDDPDDNKFVDCYVASNANLLITNDADFRKLKQIAFPAVTVITIQEFLLMELS